MLKSLLICVLFVSTASALYPYENSYHTANFTPVALNVSISAANFTTPHPLILATPYGSGVSSPGPTIYDASGAIVWHAPEWGEAHDLNIHSLNGKPVLAFWTGIEIKTGWVNGTVVILDSSYNVVDVVAAQAPYRSDFHEFQIVSDGGSPSALLTSYNRISANLTAIGGPPDGWVLDSLVQIITLDDSKALRFNWSAWEHLPLTETYATPGTRGTGTLDDPLDVAHVNSVDFAADGNSLLVSSRHYQQLIKVDRGTGEVIWRMGGMKSDFSLGSGAAYHFQHHARWHESGKAISVFDNGASDWEVIEPTARGVYLSVDDEARTVELVREWLPLFQNTTKMMGDVEILQSGNAWVDFGTSPWMMEQTADGETVFWATMGPDDPSAANGPIGSDRVFKTTEWVGRPSLPPSIAIANGTTTQVYVSWNGATEVTQYGLSTGNTPGSVRQVAQTAKSGFENSFVLSHPLPRYVSISAMGKEGSVLGTTGIFRVEDQVQITAGSVPAA